MEGESDGRQDAADASRGRPDLREAIMRACLEIGTEAGEDGLTMRAIAARLGVSATGLYQHFDGKPAILRAVRIYGLELLARHLDGAYEAISPVDRLAGESARYISFAVGNPWLYGVLMQGEEIDWSRATEAERTLVAELQARTVGCFIDGIAAGLFHAKTDVRLAPLQLWAANHGLATLIISERISETHPVFPLASRDRFVEQFARVFLRGFSCEPERP